MLNSWKEWPKKHFISLKFTFSFETLIVSNDIQMKQISRDNIRQGHRISWAASIVYIVCGSRVHGKLATIGEILWLSRRQFAAVARCEQLFEAKNRISIATSGWLFIATGFSIRLSISCIPLHAIYSTLFGSILYTRARLLPWAAWPYAIVGKSQFCTVFARNWLGIIGRIW